jgi:hypothetical protein
MREGGKWGYWRNSGKAVTAANFRVANATRNRSTDYTGMQIPGPCPILLIDQRGG